MMGIKAKSAFVVCIPKPLGGKQLVLHFVLSSKSKLPPRSFRSSPKSKKPLLMRRPPKVLGGKQLVLHFFNPVTAHNALPFRLCQQKAKSAFVVITSKGYGVERSPSLFVLSSKNAQPPRTFRPRRMKAKSAFFVMCSKVLGSSRSFLHFVLSSKSKLPPRSFRSSPKSKKRF